MTKNTDKYTRNYSNFGQYPQPGKNLPSYYDYLKNAGDGFPGLQWMIQNALSAYGPRHVIEGCAPTINGYDVTGATGYVMYNGSIIKVPATGQTTLSDGQFFIVKENGSYGVTGIAPTGVIIARRIDNNMYDARNRFETYYKNVLPNRLEVLGDILVRQHINGLPTKNITGFESISANTGIFKGIKGFSDINMQDSLNFGDTYHLKGVSQITGVEAKITNAKITNATQDIDFGGSYDIKDASEITGSKIKVGTAGGLTVGNRTLTDGEWNQLTNINSITISNAQWGYLGASNQGIATSNSPTFAGATLNGDLLIDGGTQRYIRTLDADMNLKADSGNIKLYGGSQFSSIILKPYVDGTYHIELSISGDTPLFGPNVDNIWDIGNSSYAFRSVWAYDFNDQSPFPKDTVLQKLRSIKSISGTDDLDHDTLPTELRVFNEKENKFEPTARNMGANISFNTKGIQELLEKIEHLEEEIYLLKNS